jgi:thiol-disulfide isomerase/thioredoxin
MMRATVVVIVIIIIVFLSFLLLKKNTGNDKISSIENTDSNLDSSDQNQNFDKAPEFSLSDINGNTIRLNDFEEEILVINSWATWCPFCVDELPDFVELQKEFKDKIVVIAINRLESLSKSRGFTDNLGITNEMFWVLDPSDSFYKSIGGFSMPETIFVDMDKNIRIHKRGPMELEEMISKVNLILGSN